MARHLLGWTVLLMLAGGLACKDRPAAVDAGPPPRPCLGVPGTPLCWRLPPGWSVSLAPPKPIEQSASATQPGGSGAEDAGPVEDGGVLLLDTELLASGRRKDPTAKSLHPPRVEVYRSTLPTGSTSTDFLVANRLSQQRVLGGIRVRHLEVEPIRRDGRHGFHVRDAFDVPLPQGGQAPVSQQAVLLIDGRNGYVVVVTLLEDELPRYLDELHGWLGSLSFESGR